MIKIRIENIKIRIQTYMEEYMYKLVAIDIDGTLVNDNKQLTQKTISAIKRQKKTMLKLFFLVQDLL